MRNESFSLLSSLVSSSKNSNSNRELRWSDGGGGREPVGRGNRFEDQGEEAEVADVQVEAPELDERMEASSPCSG